jgi:hypothetical protein
MGGQGGWTNDSVTTLVIPTGATSGARIIIDGTTGQIVVIGSSGAEMVLDPTSAADPELVFISSNGLNTTIIDQDTSVPGITKLRIQNATIVDIGTAIFRAGTYLFAGGGATVNNTNNAAGTYQSAAYVQPTTNFCGVAFVAPPSGIVTLHYAARLASASAAENAFLSPAVREGTVVGAGTVFLAASDNNAIQYEQAVLSEHLRYGCHVYVAGLTGGADYNVQLEGKNNNAAVTTVDRQTITVMPKVI